MSVERVGVVGAGTMGAGIAQLACLGGYETLIHDPDPAALEAGCERLRVALAKGAGRRWSEAEAEEAGGRLGGVADLADLGGCDLVVEAAPEDLELKRQLFAGWRRPGARGDPRQQHLLAAGRRDRAGGPPPRAGRRHALLQPGGAMTLVVVGDLHLGRAAGRIDATADVG